MPQRTGRNALDDASSAKNRLKDNVVVLWTGDKIFDIGTTYTDIVPARYALNCVKSTQQYDLYLDLMSYACTGVLPDVYVKTNGSSPVVVFTPEGAQRHLIDADTVVGTGTRIDGFAITRIYCGEYKLYEGEVVACETGAIFQAQLASGTMQCQAKLWLTPQGLL